MLEILMYKMNTYKQNAYLCILCRSMHFVKNAHVCILYIKISSKYQVVINCSHHTYAFCTKCVLINIFLQFLYKSMNMYNCIECNFFVFSYKRCKICASTTILKS